MVQHRMPEVGAITDISQVQNFVHQKIKDLKLLDEWKDVNGEVSKYIYFYNSVGEAVKLVDYGDKAAEAKLREIRKKMMQMVAEAESKQVFSRLSILSELHRTFIAEQKGLKKMICLAHFTLRQKEKHAVSHETLIETQQDEVEMAEELTDSYGAGTREEQNGTTEYGEGAVSKRIQVNVNQSEELVNTVEDLALGATTAGNSRRHTSRPQQMDTLDLKFGNKAFPGRIIPSSARLSELEKGAQKFSRDFGNSSSTTFPPGFIKNSQSDSTGSEEDAEARIKRKNQAGEEESKVKRENHADVWQLLSACLSGYQTTGDEVVTEHSVDLENYNPKRLHCSNDTTGSVRDTRGVSWGTAENRSSSTAAFLPGLPTGSNELKFRSITENERENYLNELGKIGASSHRALSPEELRYFVQLGSENKEFGRQNMNKCGESNVSKNGVLVKSAAAACNFARKEGPTIRSDCNLKTLEDSLEAFGLLGRLQELEKGLEDVRRRKTTVEEHEAKFKAFDKEIQQMSRTYHPDRVKNSGGSEEEDSRAHELQTALNATRTVLNVLNKTFLEDIDIDHRYEFFIKLDIGLLGNEDEVQNHVYEVLFKISLISQLKQEKIIVVIKKFLTAAQSCVRSYIQQNYSDFEKESAIAVHCLTRCIHGYKKLLAECLDVEEECRSEKMDNVYSLICSMRKDCAKQLKHLEALSALTICPFGERWRPYSSRHDIDDYYVLPFVRYINVIMTCRLMSKKERDNEETGYFSSFRKKLPSMSFSSKSDVSHEQYITVGDDVQNLYYLACYHSGNKQYKEVTRRLLRTEHVMSEDIETAFLARLIELNGDLMNEFKIEHYEGTGTKRHIVKELKMIREMLVELKKEGKQIAKGIKEMNKNNDIMKERLDKLLRDSQEISRQYDESLADTMRVKQQIDELRFPQNKHLMQ